MHLLNGSHSTTRTLDLAVLEVEASENHSRVVEAARPALVDPDLALLALVIPHTRRLVSGARHESRVSRVQVNLGDHVRMADEGAQNVIVVQTPVHYSLMVIALGRGKDALVVVRELDQVHSISLRIVRIDFFSSLEVVKADAEVFTAGDQVLAIMADVN